MSTRPRRLLIPLAGLAALAAAVPARADDMVAELSRATPIAAYGGALAWSAHDAGSDRYRLVVAAPGAAPAAAPIPSSRRAFDVSLGPDSQGRVVALYTRCKGVATRCDIYRYRLVDRRESKLGFSSPREDEAWPVQWGNRVAFVRRHAKGGRGEISDCDVPFVKTLSSTAPSRRLDRGSCGRTTGLSLRRDRIVQVTFGSPASATRFDSQVRLLSARGGAVKVIARQGSGEESNVFASPNQSATAIWLTRTGVNPEPTFVLVDLRFRRPRMREVEAHANLAGPLARDERGTLWYVEGGEFHGDDCTASAPVPCRLVRASVSPFSPLPRALLPRLTISAPSNTTPSPLFGDPFVLSGLLTRTIVRYDTIVRTDPVANVPVELLRRVDDPARPGRREGFRPTAIFATTGADGRWSHTLADPPSRPWFSAVARSAAAGVPPTYAGRGTVGTVDARMTLTVSGTSFSGTIAPAQPGRTVKIQRLLSRKCRTFQNGTRFCNDTWATVGEATVDAAGTAYAAAVAAPQPGTYTAALPFADTRQDPDAYGGRSPDTPVG
ncbi:MAG: hypothetical protein ACR2H2_14985 [Solirubrobacteraceae bacterium]